MMVAYFIYVVKIKTYKNEEINACTLSIDVHF